MSKKTINHVPFGIENWDIPSLTQKKILTTLARMDKNLVCVMSMRYYEFDDVKQLETLKLISIKKLFENDVSTPDSLTISFDGAIYDRISIKLTSFGKSFIDILKRRKWILVFMKSFREGVYIE